MLNWRKSSRSSDTANCVEVAFAGSRVAVRDSKNPDGPVLTYRTESWSLFIDEVRQGGFDRPGASR
jgi:hypothetical protein